MEAGSRALGHWCRERERDGKSGVGDRRGGGGCDGERGAAEINH